MSFKKLLTIILPAICISLSSCDLTQKPENNNENSSEQTSENTDTEHIIDDDSNHEFTEPTNDQKNSILESIKSISNGKITMDFDMSFLLKSNPIDCYDKLSIKYDFCINENTFYKKGIFEETYIYSLSEYLASHQQTLDELKEYSDLRGYIVDEENDQFISGHLNQEEGYIGYSNESNQYYLINMRDENISDSSSHYLLNSDVAEHIETANLLIAMAEKTLLNGVFNKMTNSFKLDGTLSEATYLIRELSSLGMDYEYFEVFLKDGNIYKLETKVDENFLKTKFSSGDILTNKITFELMDIGNTAFVVPSDSNIYCGNHKERTSYEFTELGYQDYCSTCRKYLNEIKAYNYDETTHVCKDSGHVDGIYTITERCYPDEYLLDDNVYGHSKYLISYFIGADGKFYNASLFSIKTSPYGSASISVEPASAYIELFPDGSRITSRDNYTIYIKENKTTAIEGSDYSLNEKIYYFYEEFDYEKKYYWEEVDDSYFDYLISQINLHTALFSITTYYVTK